MKIKENWIYVNRRTGVAAPRRWKRFSREYSTGKKQRLREKGQWRMPSLIRHACKQIKHHKIFFFHDLHEWFFSFLSKLLWIKLKLWYCSGGLILVLILVMPIMILEKKAGDGAGKKGGLQFVHGRLEFKSNLPPTLKGYSPKR